MIEFDFALVGRVAKLKFMNEFYDYEDFAQNVIIQGETNEI